MIEQIPAVSALIDEKMQVELSGIFAQITEPVILKAIIDMETPKGQELAGFLAVVASLSDKITLKAYAPAEKEEAAELDTTYLPVTGLYKGDVYSGAAFHGVPGGKEMNSFVIAIYNLAGKGQEISDKTVEKIQRLNQKTNLKICVSLACHHCPKVVAACQRIAILNEHIEAEMIDANLYPELVEKYKIERVPLVVVNDKDIYIGPKTAEEMVEIIEKTNNNMCAKR